MAKMVTIIGNALHIFLFYNIKKDNELIEFRITKRNTQFLSGFEFGVFTDSHTSDLISIKKGKISQNSLSKCAMVQPRTRVVTLLENLKVNDRVGIVWRPSPGRISVTEKYC